MIKNRNERAQEQSIIGSQKKYPGYPVPAPGDVIMKDYILKEIQTSGSVDQVKIKLAEKLLEASQAGYRYLDRVPANSTESILIFCKVDF